jgi:hypothetical protein
MAFYEVEDPEAAPAVEGEGGDPAMMPEADPTMVDPVTVEE